MTDTTDQAVEPAVADANPNALTEQAQAAEPTPPEQDVSDSSPDADDTGESDDKPKGGFQRRIGELTRNWRETERDRDYWRDLAMQHLRQPPELQPEPPKPSSAPEPVKTLADFNYDEAQFASYLTTRAAEEARKAAAEVVRQEREREAAERKEQTFKSRLQDFAKSTPDFEKLVMRDPTLPITPAVLEAVAESEDGPAVLYYLGKNREAAATIAQLPPVAAARELGKIEARIAFEREQAKKVVAAKPPVSQAPPPPPKIEAAEPEVDKDPDQMPVDEWLKWRNKQIARKRK